MQFMPFCQIYGEIETLFIGIIFCLSQLIDASAMLMEQIFTNCSYLFLGTRTISSPFSASFTYFTQFARRQAVLSLVRQVIAHSITLSYYWASSSPKARVYKRSDSRPSSLLQIELLKAVSSFEARTLSNFWVCQSEMRRSSQWMPLSWLHLNFWISSASVLVLSRSSWFSRRSDENSCSFSLKRFPKRARGSIWRYYSPMQEMSFSTYCSQCCFFDFRRVLMSALRYHSAERSVIAVLPRLIYLLMNQLSIIMYRALSLLKVSKKGQIIDKLTQLLIPYHFEYLSIDIVLYILTYLIMMSCQGSDWSQYYSFLQHEFSTIFTDCADSSPLKPLMPDILNRSEILFMQFDMQKKGKKFGIAQWRLLKIDDGKLWQVSKGQPDKPLPLPCAINVVRKIDDDEEWVEREQQFQAKIVMHFTERTDITIFFKSVIECNEIAMFLLANMRQANDQHFQRFANIFKIKIVEEVVRKIQLTKQKSNTFRTAKAKAKVLEHCRKSLNDRVFIANFLESWKSRALFHKDHVSFQLQLTEIDVKIDNFVGLVKVWARGTVSKQIVFTEQNSNVITKTGYNTLVLNQYFGDRYENIGCEDQLQIQCEFSGAVWKTERVTVNDLRKLALSHTNLEFPLASKNQQGYLRITVVFQNSTTAKVTSMISPRHYRVIDQLYNLNSQPFSLRNIHHHFTRILQNQREKHHYSVSCNRMKQFIQLLRVEQLIDKFYSVQPFSRFTQKLHRGTLIYEYFLRSYERELYYDIQKLMWNHRGHRHKRLLTALKVFDQNLKFIFSDGFYHLVKSLHRIAQRQTTNRWKEALFQRSVKGIESMAFFLAIGFLKTFPSVFVHQQFVNKRALPYNSLLFSYALRKSMPNIWTKLVNLQLNIEAYFGVHFVSLFCSLFQGDTLVRVLLAVLSQRKEDGQALLFFSLIGIFLAVVGTIDGLGCSYASAQHYMLTFEQTCKDIPNKFVFWSEAQALRAKARDLSISKQFQEISSDMTQFYLSNAYSGELGDVAQQIYQEFTCYHYKNENQLRKIMLLVDRIDIGQESQQLTLSIFQAGAKLYEHQFKGVALCQLGHFIELRLIKLDEMTIICTSGRQSYLCRIDPKEVPSNLYFHFARPLLPAQRSASECNRHMLFQAYIKDNCEIDALQNPLPTKYHEFMAEGLAKEDILFCRKYSKTFRMRQNNFNLLYSKLGWFGCHFLIPDERLINVEILSYRNGGQKQLLSRVAAINAYSRTVYGKALAPYPNEQQRKLSVQIIKQGIRTCYDPLQPSLKSTLTEASTYNSASRLASYQLDNFHIASSVHFLQFYYLMGRRLPLLGYLSYRPSQFYLLPTFTLQVATPASVCTVIISEKGLPFRHISQTQAQEIQVKSQQYTRLPSQVQFGYTDIDIYFDDFLAQLRLNILRRVIQLNKKEAGRKGKRWGSALVSTSVPIPNYKLHYFYEAMNQTKQIIQLEFRDRKTREGLTYDDYGLIGGLWTKVHCLAVLSQEQQTSYLVLQEIKRRTFILKQEDYIKTGKQQTKTLKILNGNSSLESIIDLFDNN